MAITYKPFALPSAPVEPEAKSEEGEYIESVLDPQNRAYDATAPMELHLQKELSNPHSRAKKQARWQAVFVRQRELLAQYVREELKDLKGRTRREARAEAVWKWRERLAVDRREEKMRWIHRGGWGLTMDLPSHTPPPATTCMTTPNTRSYTRSTRWSASASSAGGRPSMATFPLGLREGVEAHEPRAGLSNVLERIYNVELRIVDRSVVRDAETSSPSSSPSSAAVAPSLSPSLPSSLTSDLSLISKPSFSSLSCSSVVWTVCEAFDILGGLENVSVAEASSLLPPLSGTFGRVLLVGSLLFLCRRRVVSLGAMPCEAPSLGPSTPSEVSPNWVSHFLCPVYTQC